MEFRAVINEITTGKYKKEIEEIRSLYLQGLVEVAKKKKRI